MLKMETAKQLIKLTIVSFIGAEFVSLLHDTRLSSDDVKIRAELDVLISTIDLNAKYDKKTIMGVVQRNEDQEGC